MNYEFSYGGKPLLPILNFELSIILNEYAKLLLQHQYNYSHFG